MRDLDLTYQYSNFGVPGLGLERGLSEDLVVAPYATALAAMVDPGAAARNFTRLIAVGGRGSYGFYEALDYTPSRLPDGATVAIVRAYMAHHQGMTLIALANVLRDGVMRARFHAEPIIQATELLLQERVPRDVAVARPRAEEVQAPAHVREFVEPSFRQFTSPHDPTPRTHLLSNGRYTVMLTTAGSGYSRCAGLGVTRWREDVTRDHWGTYLFLRDVQSGAVWSAGYQPTGVEPDDYRATFSEDRAELYRRDGAITTTLEVLVSPEDDAEIRRVSVTNLGGQTREIELTSYAELVLAPPAADAAHPAFSSLFVQTECGRRSRGAAGDPPGPLGDGPGDLGGPHRRRRRPVRWRGSVRDRPRAVPRPGARDPNADVGHRRAAPVEHGGLGARSDLQPQAASSSRAGRERAAHLLHARRPVARSRRGARRQVSRPGDVRARRSRWPGRRRRCSSTISGSARTRPTCSRIWRAGFSTRTRRFGPRRRCCGATRPGPTALWAHGISGDLPIVLVRIDEPEDRGIVRQLLRAHEYWRLKGLAVDLVILNERAHSYTQELQASLEALVRTSQSASRHERHETHGKVFILRKDLLTAPERDALQAAARAILLSRHGTLAEQLSRATATPSPAAPPRRRPAGAPSSDDAPPARPEFEFFNGLGGFVDDGREYVTVLGEGQWTPAPWINVVANPALRLPGLRVRGRLHVVAQQPGESADAVVQRSRQRPARRDHLRPGRGDR